jgi:hypothetical protein
MLHPQISQIFADEMRICVPLRHLRTAVELQQALGDKQTGNSAGGPKIWLKLYASGLVIRTGALQSSRPALIVRWYLTHHAPISGA